MHYDRHKTGELLVSGKAEGMWHVVASQVSARKLFPDASVDKIAKVGLQFPPEAL